MSELVTARIRAHATRLALPGIAADPAALAARAEQAQLGYLDFLDLALGEEAGLKDSRRVRAALSSSGLPHRKTLEEFDFAFQPGIDVRKIRGAPRGALPYRPCSGQRPEEVPLDPMAYS